MLMKGGLGGRAVGSESESESEDAEEEAEEEPLAVEGEVLRDLGRFELALSVLVVTALDCFVSLSPSAIVAIFW